MGSYHEQDYYKLLEVTPDASREEIEAAYARLKGVFDETSSATFMLFGGDEAASMRHMLEEAYQTLSDDRLRERYDDSLGIKRERRAVAEASEGRAEESSSSAVGIAHATSVTSTTTPIVDARIVEEAQRPSEPAVSAKGEEAPALPPPIPTIAPTAVATPIAPPTVAATAIATPPIVAPAVVALEEAQIIEAPQATAAMVVSPPTPLDANMEFSGGVLMRLRESKGISLEQIAQRTKISMTHLRAIEANQYDKLPARVYVRGFVSQYARFLNLPQERVCESYLQIYDRFVQAKSS
jgi:hypothetical protein